MEKVDAQVCIIPFNTLANVLYSGYMKWNRNAIDRQNDSFVFPIYYRNTLKQFFTIQIENEQKTLPTKMRNSLTSSSLGRSLADLYDTVDFLIFSVSNRP